MKGLDMSKHRILYSQQDVKQQQICPDHEHERTFQM